MSIVLPPMEVVAEIMEIHKQFGPLAERVAIGFWAHYDFYLGTDVKIMFPDQDGHLPVEQKIACLLGFAEYPEVL